MTTYTATEIDAMSREERLSVFEKLGFRTYGTERFGAAFCRQSGVADKTVANWRSPTGPAVSTLAILLLQEWSGSQMSEKLMLEAFQRLIGDMSSMSRTLNDTARQVASNLSDLGELADHRDPDDAGKIDASRL